jgi:hypothetical protein
MLIDSCGRLRAAIALGMVKIHGMDGKFADRALELKAAIERLGGVITHGSL